MQLEEGTLVLDREITAPAQDAFGHRDFAMLLRSIVEDPTHSPPYSIGLLGPWGTGKSSIKSLYLADLNDDLSKVDGRKRCERVQSITFNAWRYGGDNMKRALLRHTYIALGGEEATIKDALFNQLQHTFLRPKARSELRKELLERYVWMLGQFLVLALIAVSLSLLIRSLFGLDGIQAIVVGTIFSVFSAAFVNSSTNLKSLILSRYEEVFRVELPRTSAEEYEDLLLEQLRAFSREHPHCRRLVIFVDDLDRLSAEEMVAGLDAVRTFMELPEHKLPMNLGMVFVISCDEGRIADALGIRRDDGATQLPATVSDRMDARRFLDRIFQFRVEVPPFPPQDLRTFAKDRLLGELGDVANDIENHSTGTSIDDVIDRLIHVDVQDPRNALQILNAFAQSWRLAKWREHVGIGGSRPGGLQPLAVTEHPEALAALSVLRVNFPGFYAELQKEPSLIEYFTRYFLRATHEGIPEHAVWVLKQYAVTAESGEDASAIQVRAEFASLRRYMVSLQGLRWPRSVQPLLLLAQDPISRQYGDRARLVLDGLVSGDEHGVLDGLGHAFDQQPLSLEDAQLLRNLQQGLLNDTEVRQNNAAAAIAGLADRLPAEQARSLLAPVARRVAQSPELAWRLGVARLGRMLPLIDDNDRQDVASRLIVQLLPLDSPVDFLTPEGETPTLDEAVEMVEAAIPLVLTVLQSPGLSPASRAKLRQWWIRHTVVTEHSKHTVPFRQLEDWTRIAETRLLDELGADYGRLVAIEFETRVSPDFPLDPTVRRSEAIFNRLWDKDRSGLWELLPRFVALQSEPIMTTALTAMREHAQSPDGQDVSAFVTSLAQRLMKDTEGGDWGLNSRQVAGETLLHLVDRRAGDLLDGAWGACRPLAATWAEDDDTSLLAVRLLDLMANCHKTEAQVTIDQWISRVEHLSKSCVSWLAIHFADQLSEEQRTTLMEQLGKNLEDRETDDDLLGALSAFAASLTAKEAASTQVQQFFEQALDQLQTWSSNPNDYVTRVFPAIAPLVPLVPRTEVDPALSQLFTQVQGHGDIDLLGVLHETLIGLWPSAEDGTAYDPNWYFEQAAELIPQAKATEAGVQLLRSMDDMYTRKLLGKDAESKLLEAAVSLWSSQPEVAADVIEKSQVSLVPSEIVALAQASQLSDEASRDRLKRIWSHEDRLLDEQRRIETAQLIVAEPAHEFDGDPDQLLSLWLEARAENREAFLVELATNADLNDDQEARVWSQIVRRVGQLSSAQLLGALDAAFQDDPEERTRAVIFANRRAFSDRFSSHQERFELGRTLLNGFIQCESAELRRELGQWLQELEVDSVLDDLNSLGASADTLDVLREFFPNHSALRRA